MAKEINVAEEINRFKVEVIPSMSLAELQALQKFLKAEIESREAATPDSSPGALRSAIKAGIKIGRDTII